ncbi:hypothetical protein NT01EI_2287 [Edwardsiella ictaluri 93-146]|uniref:Uncharacterized protein n=1 Tax=Edwardsiella ictaluri (strain 93-146) TaxID=634503 RepID=C5BH27_EDWI9|nr:hypothetical protein NT01EI_2287 [Edwardsiella ictaluri 93-146]
MLILCWLFDLHIFPQNFPKTLPQNRTKNNHFFVFFAHDFGIFFSLNDVVQEHNVELRAL